MRFWNFFTSFFTAKKQLPFHVAVLVPRSSIAVEKYINLTIAELKNNLTRPLTITQYSNISDEAEFSSFIRDAKEVHFDIVLAITSIPALQARRVYTEHGLFIPTLVITYEDLLPHPLPNHINALLAVNRAPLLFQIIKEHFNQVTKIIFCGRLAKKNSYKELSDLSAMLLKDKIEIIHIDLKQSEQKVMNKIAAHAPSANLLFLPQDALAFSMMPDIITAAHSHKCPVMASELPAINYGADIAVGYPAQAIAKETALQIARIATHTRTELRFFKTRQEVHCRFGSNLSWINSQTDYHFKIIGATDSAKSGPAQQSTQEQSATQ